MPLVIRAADNEFSTATGWNVGTTRVSSTFDHPPVASRNLVITADDGDDEPRLFEPGETYDLSWNGRGGARTLKDAVIVRSDAAPGEGGIVVFEGQDAEGGTAQVIWTPDFDLEGWYRDHFSPKVRPQFYTEDMQPDYTHGYVCFAAETRIATPDGGRAAGALRAGDTIVTADGGPGKLIWTCGRTGPGTGARAPVLFAPGTIGNRRALRLSQQHRVLIRAPWVQLALGMDEVLVPARACVDGQGIRLDPCASIRYVHLLLACHAVLLAEGAPCESLFLGDQAVDVLEIAGTGPGRDRPPPVRHHETARPVLGMAEAERLMWRSGAGPVRPPRPARARGQTSRELSFAARTKSAKSGCGAKGFDFSSGWNCTPMNHG